MQRVFPDQLSTRSLRDLALVGVGVAGKLPEGMASCPEWCQRPCGLSPENSAADPKLHVWIPNIWDSRSDRGLATNFVTAINS